MPENQEIPDERPKPKKRPVTTRERIQMRLTEDAKRNATIKASRLLGIHDKAQMLRNWEKIASGECPPDFPLRLADAGREMTAADKINAVDGSSVIVQSHLTALIMQLKSFVKTREDAVELVPIICKAVDTLTKLNSQAIATRVDIANANKGIKALSGAMYVQPPQSFQPGEIITIEQDIRPQDVPAPAPEPVPTDPPTV